MDSYEQYGGLGGNDEYDDYESGYGVYGRDREFGGGDFRGALGGENYGEEENGSYGGAGFGGDGYIHGYNDGYNDGCNGGGCNGGGY